MSTCPWWCLSATRPRSPDVAARADDPPSLGVRVLSGVLFESLCTSTTTHPTVRLPPRPGGKKPLCPHTPTKREEPRDELCSSSTWPQTAPLTPRPVGRMGAVRACLKRRHSSAPVHARRAEGRALVAGERGARGAAEVARTCFLLNSPTKLTNHNTPQPPPAREASEASLPPLRARKGSMRACHSAQGVQGVWTASEPPR